MNRVLYFSPNDVVYETRAFARADISELVLDHGVDSLTSADRQFDFWFAPSARKCQRGVNRSATEMLLANSLFTANTVPLLRGVVVVATHDADGDLDGLSWQQLDQLAKSALLLTGRDDRTPPPAHRTRPPRAAPHAYSGRHRAGGARRRRPLTLTGSAGAGLDVPPVAAGGRNLPR